MTPAELQALDVELAPWRDERARRSYVRAGQFRRWAEEATKAGENSIELQRQYQRLAAVATSRAIWHERRAQVKPLATRVAACGTVNVELACQHCGVVGHVTRRCGARLTCTDCGKRHYARMRRRLVTALEARLADARAEWRRQGSRRGQEPRASLLTLTIKHSGDMKEDRRALSAAWHRYTAWWHSVQGVPLSYTWTIEVTNGRDGLGHVHAHVVALMPLVDYRQLHEAWKRATLGKSSHIDVNTGARGANGTRINRPSPQKAARYLASYATKGCGELAPHLRASWVRAQHGMRSVSASRGWWLPSETDDCLWRHQPPTQVVALTPHTPHAVVVACSVTWPRPPPNQRLEL